jgi:hypothetical protein
MKREERKEHGSYQLIHCHYETKYILMNINYNIIMKQFAQMVPGTNDLKIK